MSCFNNFFETREQKIGTFICLFAAVVFGLYPPAAKAAYEDGANIVFIVLLTTFMRFVAMYGFAYLNGIRTFFETSQARKLSFWGGLFQAASIVGILGGAYYLPGAVVIIIMFTYSLMLLFYSAWRGNYKLNSINIAMTITGLVGLFFVLGLMDEDVVLNPTGVMLSIVAAFATFVRVTLFSMQNKSRSPSVVGMEAYLIAFFFLCFLLPFDLPSAPHSLYGWGMALLSGLSLAIGSFGIFYGISFLGPYRFSMVTKFEPIFTVFFGLLLLGEILVLSQYIGILVVIGSLITLQIFDRQREK